MRKVTISLAQMDVMLARPNENLANGAELIAEAARRGSDVILLPELWLNGYPLRDSITTAEPLSGVHLENLRALASTHRIAIIGSFLEQHGDRVYNSAPVISPRGEIMGVYRKMYLFSYMHEDDYLSRGDELSTFSFPWGKAAVAICYDIRFPELFRAYADAGVEIVFVVAEWPHPRMPHWSLLLQARAVENLYYVVGCNRVGREGETVYGGASAAYDPWGKPIVKGGEEPLLLTFSIDLDRVSEVRRRFPALEDRRQARLPRRRQGPVGRR